MADTDWNDLAAQDRRTVAVLSGLQAGERRQSCGISPRGWDGACEAVVPELQGGQAGESARGCPVHGQLSHKDVLLQVQICHILRAATTLANVPLWLHATSFSCPPNP